MISSFQALFDAIFRHVFGAHFLYELPLGNLLTRKLLFQPGAVNQTGQFLRIKSHGAGFSFRRPVEPAPFQTLEVQPESIPVPFQDF